MSQLVKNLGDKFNLEISDIENLDLEKFVTDAIKVEAGELSTLRVSFNMHPQHKHSSIYALLGISTYLRVVLISAVSRLH